MIIKLIKGIRSVFVNPQTHFSLFSLSFCSYKLFVFGLAVFQHVHRQLRQLFR